MGSTNCFNKYLGMGLSCFSGMKIPEFNDIGVKKERCNRPLIPVRTKQIPKIGRNGLCTCGSGKKYKKCCGLNY